MPNSWSSLRWAAFLTPATESGRLEPVSLGTPSGCEQHVLGHMSGKVIFSDARCCSSMRFWLSNRKTEKARCRSPLSILVMRWPVGGQPAQGLVSHALHSLSLSLCPVPLAPPAPSPAHASYVQSFLLAVPIGMSLSSIQMHNSSMKRI